MDLYVFNDYYYVSNALLGHYSCYIVNDSLHLQLLPLMFLAGWLTILHLHPILPL